MFSLFCDPSMGCSSEETEDDMAYLDKKCARSFDTVETDGTEDTCLLDKNCEGTTCESLLEKGVLVVDDTCELVEKQNDMNDDLVMTREGGDVREAVPYGRTEEGTNSPGSVADLLVPETVEGPDMPTHEHDKLKIENLNVLEANVPAKTMSEDSIGASTALILYQPKDNLEELCAAGEAGSVSSADDPARDVEAEPTDTFVTPRGPVFGAVIHDGERVLSPDANGASDGESVAERDDSSEATADESMTVEELKVSNVTSDVVDSAQEDETDTGMSLSEAEAPGSGDKCVSRSECDTLEGKLVTVDVESHTSSSLETAEPLHVDEPHTCVPSPPSLELESEHDREPRKSKDLAETETGVVSLPDNGESHETSPKSEPQDADTSSGEVEMIASGLLLPILNHSDNCQRVDNARMSPLVDSENDDVVDPTDSPESEVTDESGSEKSVRFAEPLVTSSWDVPRIDSDDLDALFYTAMDISKFRREQKEGAPPRPYDKEHCERLVEDLDRLGAESFVAGDYQKALGAFNHSLQVKTQIMTADHRDNVSTATTIHCIADVYSKKGKWIQAMDAYNAALQMLEKVDDTEEVRLSRVALEQKVHIIRRLLGLKRRKPS